MKFLLGKKVGMTTVIGKDGNLTPVTIISAGPCFITQIKIKGKDGYSAVQIGYVEAKKLKKPQEGHLGKIRNPKSEIRKLKNLKEFRTNDEKLLESLKLGDEIRADVFAKGDKVKIAGNIKAKGFAGAIKRWGFKSHPAGHGHPHERRVGSIGSMYPQRVFKGKKMAGREGPARKTVRNLQVIEIDKENNLLLVKGSVPGVRGGLVEIRG